MTNSNNLTDKEVLLFLRHLVKKNVKQTGVKMSKMIHPGGLFTSSLTEYRTVYTTEEVSRLNSDGWYIETNLEIILWNAIMVDDDDE